MDSFFKVVTNFSRHFLYVFDLSKQQHHSHPDAVSILLWTPILDFDINEEYFPYTRPGSPLTYMYPSSIWSTNSASVLKKLISVYPSYAAPYNRISFKKNKRKFCIELGPERKMPPLLCLRLKSNVEGDSRIQSVAFSVDMIQRKNNELLQIDNAVKTDRLQNLINSMQKLSFISGGVQDMKKLYKDFKFHERTGGRLGKNGIILSATRVSTGSPVIVKVIDTKRVPLEALVHHDISNCIVEGKHGFPGIAVNEHSFIGTIAQYQDLINVKGPRDQEDNFVTFMINEKGKGVSVSDHNEQSKTVYTLHDLIPLLTYINVFYRMYFIKYYAIQMLVAIHFLHRMNYVHMDIKPENFLINELNGIENPFMGIVKLIDMGEIVPVGERQKIYAYNGSPAFMAPEVAEVFYLSLRLQVKPEESDEGRIPGYADIVTGVDKAADMWSFGMSLLFMLNKGGNPFPFRNRGAFLPMLSSYKVDDRELTSIIDRILGSMEDETSALQGQEHDVESIAFVKGDLKLLRDLLKGILTVNPSTRLSAMDALKHLWFNDEDLRDEIKVLEGLHNNESHWSIYLDPPTEQKRQAVM